MILRDNFAYFFIKKICSGCSLESPHRGDSNEHQQHMIGFDEDLIKIIIKFH